jgi:hypothetical protein
VRRNVPSQDLHVGDYVRVPWGLDTLDGVVEDVYETGAGPRVTVRVLDPDTSEEAETVTLPAEAIQSAYEAEGRPPGAWITGARYERDVAKALQRLLPAVLEEFDFQPQSWPEPRVHPDHRPDLIIQAGPRWLVVEAKTGGPGKKVAAEGVQQLRAFLANLPKQALGLLVTNAELAPRARELLDTTPRLHAVRWRSARDDGRLADALASLLVSNKW